MTTPFSLATILRLVWLGVGVRDECINSVRYLFHIRSNSLQVFADLRHALRCNLALLPLGGHALRGLFHDGGLLHELRFSGSNICP